MLKGHIEIRKKYQLTLPADLCSLLGCTLGTYLHFIEVSHPKNGNSYFDIALFYTGDQKHPKARLLERNQITLPKKVVHKLGVEVGDSIRFFYNDGRIQLGRIDKFFSSDEVAPLRQE